MEVRGQTSCWMSSFIAKPAPLCLSNCHRLSSLTLSCTDGEKQPQSTNSEQMTTNTASTQPVRSVQLCRSSLQSPWTFGEYYLQSRGISRGLRRPWFLLLRFLIPRKSTCCQKQLLSNTVMFFFFIIPLTNTLPAQTSDLWARLTSFLKQPLLYSFCWFKG